MLASVSADGDQSKLFNSEKAISKVKIASFFVCIPLGVGYRLCDHRSEFFTTATTFFIYAALVIGKSAATKRSALSTVCFGNFCIPGHREELSDLLSFITSQRPTLFFAARIIVYAIVKVNFLLLIQPFFIHKSNRKTSLHSHSGYFLNNTLKDNCNQNIKLWHCV